ncbi:MAG: hypothetical protein ACLTSX_14270 [Collinsella sp.]
MSRSDPCTIGTARWTACPAARVTSISPTSSAALGVDDIFSSIFGGLAAARAAQRRATGRAAAPGRDMAISLSISLEEAVHGLQEDHHVRPPRPRARTATDPAAGRAARSSRARAATARAT